MVPRHPTLPLLCAAAALLTASCVQYDPAQAGPPEPPPPYAQAGPPPSPPMPPDGAPPALSPRDLDTLLGPIALYPDPLLALILTASTAPGDIAAAGAYLVQYGDSSQIDRQPWDPSVRSLAHYPTVVAWLTENPEWTRALGEAFLASPPAVMQSIQRLRNEAIASGALASNPEQQVLSGDEGIEILPARADALYAPAYDPDLVFGAGGGYAGGGPLMNFGLPFEAGPWLSYDLDWQDDEIWEGPWTEWNGPGGWYAPRFHAGHAPPGVHRWHRGGRPTGGAQPPRNALEEAPPRPRPMPGAPQFQGRVAGEMPPGARATAAQGAAHAAGAPTPSRAPAGGQAARAAPAAAAHSETAHESAAAPAHEAATPSAGAADPKNH